MTRVSRVPLSNKEKLSLTEEFWNTLGELNKTQVEHFFREFFSPTEIVMFAKRLHILKSLRQNTTYEHIQQGIKVTEPTIAKMSAILQRGDEDFFRILDYLIRDENSRWQAYLDSRKPHIRGKMIFHVNR